jgi:hypothetical protein
MPKIHIAKMCFAVVVLLILEAPMVKPQSAQVTNNILFRVVMVKSQFGQGTMFSIDVDQREYWITAKHVLTGAQHPPYGSVVGKSVILKVLDPKTPDIKWISRTFSVIDPGADIDIVALAPKSLLLDSPLPNPVADSTGAPVGGDCEFLGFPFGAAWQASFANGRMLQMPFIKHCTLSGRIAKPQDVWVLDGINNEGFSGGPVVIFTGPAQQILAVVSGYRYEPTPVIPIPPDPQHLETQNNPHRSGEPPKEMVNLNSGFIVAFDIHYAVEAIKKNPIGPLRQPK